MRLYKKIVDYRIWIVATADAIAKLDDSIILVIWYGDLRKAVYLFGKRIIG